MNTEEKDFGILISCNVDKEGACKEVIYLKDAESRHFTCGTPVVFDLQSREVPYDTGCKHEGTVTLEVATNVRLDEEKIGDHKIISKLNILARLLLERDRKASGADAHQLIEQIGHNIEERNRLMALLNELK